MNASEQELVRIASTGKQSDLPRLRELIDALETELGEGKAIEINFTFEIEDGKRVASVCGGPVHIAFAMVRLAFESSTSEILNRLFYSNNAVFMSYFKRKAEFMGEPASSFQILIEGDDGNYIKHILTGPTPALIWMAIYANEQKYGRLPGK